MSVEGASADIKQTVDKYSNGPSKLSVYQFLFKYMHLYKYLYAYSIVYTPNTHIYRCGQNCWYPLILSRPVSLDSLF